MTNNYHTPISQGAAANAETFNVPLGEMDEALTEALLEERDGHIIQDEGVDLAQQARLDFVGAGVTVTNTVGKTIVTIPGTSGDYLTKDGLTEWGEQGSDPSTPASGKWKVYFKAGGMYIIDDAGTVLGPIDIRNYLAKTGLTEWDEQGSDPSTPASGKWKVYFKAGGMYIIDDAGTVLGPLSAGSGDTTEYKLSVTVSSNDLIVAIKDKDGNDPSPSSPVKIKIGDTVRTLSTALSVTLADATNWYGFGSADKAAVEQDLFVYLGYNATDGITIGVSPIPFALKYGDFSTTATAETYCKISTITNAASADPYIVIGRCAATLSAAAGHVWTVPTFTPDNLVHRPIYETRKLSFTPQWTGVTVGNGTVEVYYQRISRVTKGKIRLVWGSTTSYSGNVTVAPPTTHKQSPTGTSYFAIGSVAMVDAGTALYMGETLLNAGVFEIRAIGASGSYANWAYATSSIPHTWANTDVLEIDFEYFN